MAYVFRRFWSCDAPIAYKIMVFKQYVLNFQGVPQKFSTYGVETIILLVVTASQDQKCLIMQVIAAV